MELKKSKEANLERKKFGWRALGACSVLSLLLVSFVITSYDIKELDTGKKVQNIDELEEEIVAASTPPPPPPPCLLYTSDAADE